MSSRRVLRAAEAIREVVSMAILTELQDPRIQDVTVTFVEVSADLRLAKVHVSVMGDDTKQQLCLHGLQNSAGFLQRKVGDRIDTRYTPKVQFILDLGIKHATEVNRILNEVLPAESPQDQAPEEDTPEEDTPEEDTPEEDTPEEDTPEEDTPEEDIPDR
jgi:ribosome-binding factor A